MLATAFNFKNAWTQGYLIKTGCVETVFCSDLEPRGNKKLPLMLVAIWQAICLSCYLSKPEHPILEALLLYCYQSECSIFYATNPWIHLSFLEHWGSPCQSRNIQHCLIQLWFTRYMMGDVYVTLKSNNHSAFKYFPSLLMIYTYINIHTSTYICIYLYMCISICNIYTQYFYLYFNVVLHI